MPVRRELNCIMVSQQVALMAICQTPDLVSTKAAGLIKVSHHAIVGKQHALMTAKGFMDVYRSVLLYYHRNCRHG